MNTQVSSLFGVEWDLVLVVVDIYYSDMPEDSNIITWYAYIYQSATGPAIVGLQVTILEHIFT